MNRYGLYFQAGFMAPGRHRAVIFLLAYFLTNHCIGSTASSSLPAGTLRLGSMQVFDRKQSAYLSDMTAWEYPEGTVTRVFRKLKGGKTADIVFRAFDVDASGYCRHDMVLEIVYREDLFPLSDKEKVSARVKVQARLDYTEEEEYFEIGHLEMQGSGEWKMSRIYLRKTPWQMIRSISGKFHFRFLMPATSSIGIPIESICLRAVSGEEFHRLREEELKQRGFRRIQNDLPLASVPEGVSPQASFAIWPISYLQLVFPDTPVVGDKPEVVLRCFEISGESEPVTFIVHAHENLKNVQIQTTELVSGNHHIPIPAIEVQNVIYNDQRLGFMTSRRYSACPDYLCPMTAPVDVSAGCNRQFWLTIHIPPDTPAGHYSGGIRIFCNTGNSQTIPLHVEVLDLALRKGDIGHMIYHSPFKKNFHPDPVKVFKDMKDHGLVPVFYPPSKLIRKAGLLNVELSEFKQQLVTFRRVDPDAKAIFIGLFNYYQVWNELKGPKPWFESEFPLFNTMYGRILCQYRDLAKSFGLDLYFSFQDEPFKDVNKRRMSWLCSHIAQLNGLKTWCAHDLTADVPLSSPEGHSGLYLGPLREVLDVFVEATIRLDNVSGSRIQDSSANLSYYTTYLATGIRPVYNRFLHGLYPSALGSRFVVSYAYRDLLVDPYDDFDVSTTLPFEAGMNDYLLTYPTWQGDIYPTLVYEALREGIEDQQIISTLQYWIEKARNSRNPELAAMGEENQKHLEGVLKRVNVDFKNNYWDRHKDERVDPMETAILHDLKEGEVEDYSIFDQIRYELCQRIIQLSKMVGKNI